MTNSALEKQHRYRVWLLAKDQALKAQESLVPGGATAVRQVKKLSDLETLLLVYGCGRPMDLAVPGTFTLPDGQAAPCQTKKVSTEAIDFVYEPPTPETPSVRPRMQLGSRVSLDLEKVGAVKGVLTAQNEEGFQVAVAKDGRSRLGDRLAHIAVEKGIGVNAVGSIKTGVARIEPKNKDCGFTDHTGQLRKGMLVNLSRYDALIRAPAAFIPPLGTRIVLRGPEWHGGDVISTFEIGFIAKFCIPIPEAAFSPSLKFTDE